MSTQIVTSRGLLATFDADGIGSVPLDQVAQSRYGMRMMFSPDGRRLACVLKDDGGERAVVDPGH